MLKTLFVKKPGRETYPELLLAIARGELLREREKQDRGNNSKSSSGSRSKFRAGLMSVGENIGSSLDQIMSVPGSLLIRCFWY